MITTAARSRALLSAAGAERIVSYLCSVQSPQGGFYDRSGRPDIYYTAFGLDGLLALGRTIPHPDKIRAWLAVCRNISALSFADLMAFIRCANATKLTADTGDSAALSWLAPAMEPLRLYRSRDGGFSHERHRAEHGTLYAAFLIDQAATEIAALRGCAPKNPLALVARLGTPDGGYANHVGMSHGSGTATAAAAVLLVRYGQRDAARPALVFLETLRDPDGGYRATPTAPAADVLSTAAVLYARRVCDEPFDEADRSGTTAFVERLWSDSGGFRGHAADPYPDAEYTFYALLALGALVKETKAKGNRSPAKQQNQDTSTIGAQP